MSNFPIMTPLKFWTQKILPLVYDDSISYLEMLGKVRSKLNELIEYYNGLKDVIPKEAQELYDSIAEKLNDDLQSAIHDLNDALTADIGDLNDAKQSAIGDINDAVTEAEGTIDTYALEKVQEIISEYDSALAPLLTPSATAVELDPGESPTASYSNGVFTFGLPGNQGDMTVAEYGGSEAGVVAEADNAASLGGDPAADYMKKQTYDANNNGIVDQAESADDADALGGKLADEYMLKEDYTGAGTAPVSKANDSARLGGQVSGYYATAAQVAQLQSDISALQQIISSADITTLKQAIGTFSVITRQIPLNVQLTFTFPLECPFMIIYNEVNQVSGRCIQLGYQKNNDILINTLTGNNADFYVTTSDNNLTIQNTGATDGLTVSILKFL
jgi:hypothetical protein